MNRFGFLSLAGAALFATAMIQPTAISQGTAASFKLDSTHAHVVFRINHMGFSDTWGRFNKLDGSFEFNAADASANKVTIEIATGSVDSQVAKRDGHLMSPDFFSAKEFPKVTFVSSAWKSTGDKTYDVTGKLTLHGVSKEITIPVTFGREGKGPGGAYRAGFTSEFTIQRSDFGMKTYLPGVGDDVKLYVSIEGVKQ
jgi:polyisoprenoid-binding protein YceI